VSVAKKIFLYSLAILILGVVFFFLGRCTGGDTPEYRASKARVTELESEIIGFRKLIESADRDHSELVKIQSDYESLQSKYEDATGKLGIINQGLKKLGSENGEKIDGIIRLLETIERIVREGKN
jgi:hypothetical protein